MNDNDADAQLNVTPDTQADIDHARDYFSPTHDIFPDANIGALLQTRAQSTPDANWLTYYDENGRSGSYTYGQFLKVSRLLVAWMQADAQITFGDRIATLLVNDPRAVLAYFAAWTLGATIVPINPAEDEERIRYILYHSHAKALLVPAENQEKWSRLVQTAPTSENTNGPFPTIYPLSAALCDYDSATALPLFHTPPLRDLPGFLHDAECLIVYTSGTTGPPKGVVLEHGNLMADAFPIAYRMGFTADDRAMNVLPLHHVNGIVVTLHDAAREWWQRGHQPQVQRRFVLENAGSGTLYVGQRGSHYSRVSDGARRGYYAVRFVPIQAYPLWRRPAHRRSRPPLP